jgi:TolB-like protein
VLPFANMSGDPEQEYFADGMVEEIITALSRICWLFVTPTIRPSPTRARPLAAILAADVAEYSRLMGADGGGALDAH